METNIPEIDITFRTEVIKARTRKLRKRFKNRLRRNISNIPIKNKTEHVLSYRDYRRSKHRLRYKCQPASELQCFHSIDAERELEEQYRHFACEQRSEKYKIKGSYDEHDMNSHSYICKDCKSNYVAWSNHTCLDMLEDME